jgi:hypothetical protein
VLTRVLMLCAERVSAGSARAVPPRRWISRATVLMVDWRELGSGGKEVQVVGSEVDFAETTTARVRTGDIRVRAGLGG